MNIHKSIAGCTFTLFSCTNASRYQVADSFVPIKFMGNAQVKDMLIGLIYSEIDTVNPPLGLQRELIDAQLYCMAKVGSLDKSKEIPLFTRQNEVIDTLNPLKIDRNSLMGRNEALIRAGFEGTEIPFKTIVDVINTQHIFDTFHTTQSYDLNKISQDGQIYHRVGYRNEYYERQHSRFSLYNIPVLSDKNKAFGSQFCDFNDALIDENTQSILTVMFGFGLSVQHFNAFSENLILLKNNQEEHIGMTTSRMQIISGFPALHVHDLVCHQTPTIIVQKI